MTISNEQDQSVVPAPWHVRLLGRDRTVIPVVRLSGVIESASRPDRINIHNSAPLLKRAFSIKRAPAVAIIINSPGGSPVQSRLVAKYIRDLAAEKNKQVLVFIEDVAASGGYFIASAGDEIIADPSSIVGSIGVISASFGFEDAIEKIGVKRRLYTAGKNKSTLDPFLPEKKADIDRLKKLQLDIHDVFIDYVKSRRGDKLDMENQDLFTGEFWTAKTGIEFGLVDRLGDMHEVLREKFGKKVKLERITPKRPFFSMPRLPFMQINGAEGSFTDDLIASVEAKSMWSRFGL
ncbi:S49 family peptidase [Maritalea porphyrae]|jgi:signal peptide peptidase SppA|uniref:S49 family peptidase n=1 Tax=Maritalea porphyrae TaxID=880732 RepID=UPI0022AF6687|nr:S49 family peptidase [Maritalea porphyrae]MCZ4271349.1 S49 family peptidase [Maritalea porphyrae]